MRKLSGLFPIVLLTCLAIFWGSQRSQSQVAATPDYEDVRSPSPSPLLRNELPNSLLCTVTKVSDGDTINVNCDGQKKRVRLCGIDAPETEHGSKAGQPLGEESKAMLKRLVEESGNKVGVATHEVDRYGRDIAEVWENKGDNGKLFNTELVQAGLAYNYKKYSGRCLNAESIDSAETLAKEKRLGVWDGKRYEYPWDFRRAQRN